MYIIVALLGRGLYDKSLFWNFILFVGCGN